MTNGKHTPGPWHYIGDGFDSCAAADCGTDGYTVITRDSEGAFEGTICEIDYQNDDAEAEANARLIAAAPELLEALEGMFEDFISIPEMRDKPEYIAKVVAERKEKARAAIAKAKGESA